jgi:phosphatidylinositol alpha-mannosyltransferase
MMTIQEVRMRIALVSDFYYPHLGGVTEHVHNLAVQYNRMGHHAIVVTSNMKDQGADPEFVRRIGTSRVVYANASFTRITTGFGLRAQLAGILRAEKIEVVHVHGALAPTFGLLAPHAGADCGIPVVATFHSWFPRCAPYRVFRKHFQRHLDLLSARIAVSEPVVSAMSRYFTSEWVVIPNGVNVVYFHPNGRRPTDALERGPRLLFLGRLDPRNGLDTMLAAMPEVLSAFSNAQLIVVGDGPLRARYEKAARDLRDNVTFVGQIFNERPEYYGGADLYVCPTSRASFGITLLESMACATPMIVSDIIGFRELVDGGAEALLVPATDPSAWARAVIRLTNDPARRELMGAAGLMKAATYSWPRVAERVLKVYQRVSA